MSSSRIRTCLRLSAGPLTLCAFFLPWGHGPGPLGAVEFSGYSLVAFSGRLQILDLSLAEGSALWAVRLALLGVVVAGAWLALLAPFGGPRVHPAYHLSGAYIVAAAFALVAIGLARSGFVMPPAGFALLLAGALGYLAAEATEPASRYAFRVFRSFSRSSGSDSSTAFETVTKGSS